MTCLNSLIEFIFFIWDGILSHNFEPRYGKLSNPWLTRSFRIFRPDQMAYSSEFHVQKQQFKCVPWSSFSREFQKSLGRAQKHPTEVFNKKNFLNKFEKLSIEHLHQSLFFNKVTELRPATLLRKRLRQKCFPVNFFELLRIPILQNIPGRLLLIMRWILIEQLHFHLSRYLLDQS